MRRWSIVVPVVGACLAAGFPLARYAERQRAEAVAVSALGQVQAAQERFRSVTGAYATDLPALVDGCGEASATLPAAVFDELNDAGYVLQLRAAVDASLTGRDCHGGALATDYYVAAAPQSAWEAAEKAYAARSDGRLFVFVDGIPPREVDIAHGLATPIEALNSFRIP